jgi:heme exporter protein D
MDAIGDFLAMGGHAAFVWPAYGITALVLVGLFIAGRRFQSATEAELSELAPQRRRRNTDGDIGKDTADEA